MEFDAYSRDVITSLALGEEEKNVKKNEYMYQ